MDNNELVKHIEGLSEKERKVIAAWLRRHPVVRDIHQEYRQQLTFGERLADRVASFGGSWTFIFLFLGCMAIWMLINRDKTTSFDPYPYILLNLVLSCVAALQAPVIMMSQNRQAVKDRLEAQHDYEVNTRAEMEIMSLHTKVDQLRDAQWQDLLGLQRRQVELLEEIRGQWKDASPKG